MKTYIATIVAGIIMAASVRAAVIITEGTYTQNFNSIGSGVPEGWGVYYSATSSALGTAQALGGAKTWTTNTPVGFYNYASAVAPLTAGSNATIQNNATNRALGVAPGGSSASGNPGAAFAFNFSTQNVAVTSLSFDAQQLNVIAPTGTSTWSIQYGLGASPSSWVTLGTYTGPGAWGATALSYDQSDFGAALDGQSEVWFRFVVLSAGNTSTGGYPTHFAIDNFSLTAVPEPASVALFGIGAVLCLTRLRRRS